MEPTPIQQTGQRISVVGTTGAGKTTTAQHISRRLQLPHIELDALYWDENWTGIPESLFLERVRAAVSGERWVIDGNYSRIRHLVWARADTVVYLDYSFGRIFWQLFQRTIRRSLKQQELWSGNRENWRKSFFSRESILWWMLRTYYRRKKQYAELFQQPAYSHLAIIHLQTPRMTREWWAKL